MLEKSCRKEAKFDLDFKRRVREGRACRAEGGIMVACGSRRVFLVENSILQSLLRGPVTG